MSKRLNPSAFTIKTILRRLDRQSDLWKSVIGAGIDLQESIGRLARHRDRPLE